MKFIKATILCSVLSGAAGFSVETSRREAIQAAMGGIATAVAPSLIAVLPANAVVDEETPRIITRMGGLLVCHLERCVRSFLYISLAHKQNSLLLPKGTLSRRPKIYSNDGAIWLEQIRW